MYRMIFIILSCLTFNSGAIEASQQKGRFAQSPIQITKEFKVNGIQAWAEARKNGFQFYPEGFRGQNKDGASTSYFSRRDGGYCTHFDYKGSAKIVGGVNMILIPCRSNSMLPPLDSWAIFKIFSNKRLKPGWKVKEVKLTGNYQWVTKWKANSNSLHSKVKLTNSSHQRNATRAMIKEITLIGPANGKWQDAFDVM